MRRASKIDVCHRQVRDALRNCGALVFDTSHVGQGFPDLVVNWRNAIHLVEVKVLHGKLTPDQEIFTARWPVTILHSAAEAYAWCGVSCVGQPRSQWESLA